jgi:hypothetical protein
VRRLALPLPGIREDGFHITAEPVMDRTAGFVDFLNHQALWHFVNHLPPFLGGYK